MAFSKGKLIFELPETPETPDCQSNTPHSEIYYGNRLARKYPGLHLNSFVVAAPGFERVCFLDMGKIQITVGPKKPEIAGCS
ncbi:MAG: hypothetical protein WCR46_19590 [Deltaproteobacteria bacterium]